MWPKLKKFILIPVASTVLIYFGIAFGLIISQPPEDLDMSKTISFDSIISNNLDFNIAISDYAARDGVKLPVRHLASKSEQAPLIIIIHGSGWHGGGYLPIAKYLSENGDFNILIPDLRGHGEKPQRRGDIDYIGQLEDDLSDLIKAFKKPNSEVIMIGHSSGGGLVIRYAGGPYGADLNKAILLSPFLKYDAPTIRQNAGGWARPLIRRIIGLSMLNSIGVNWFNGMTIMQFKYPESVLNGPQGHTATQSYSFRLNTSFHPRDAYLEDIKKLPEFLLVSGKEDDAFLADQFQPTMEAVTQKGEYKIIDGVDHLGIISNETALMEILDFLK